MSHLALVRASTDGKSLGKLKMTLAALQCRLLSESKSTERFVPPHTEIPYVTAGIITLKYRFRRSCLGKNLLFFMRLNLLTKLFFSPLICTDQFSLSSISTPRSQLYVTRSRMLSPRYMGGWGPIKDPLWISMHSDFFGCGVSLFLTHHAYNSVRD